MEAPASQIGALLIKATSKNVGVVVPGVALSRQELVCSCTDARSATMARARITTWSWTVATNKLSDTPFMGPSRAPADNGPSNSSSTSPFAAGLIDLPKGPNGSVRRPRRAVERFSCPEQLSKAFQKL